MWRKTKAKAVAESNFFFCVKQRTRMRTMSKGKEEWLISLNNLDKILLTSWDAALPFLNCKDPNLASAKATCYAIVSSSC